MPTPATMPTATRYQRVAQALLAEISGGRYPVGSHLPTEAKLEERFGVSRHTVRAAIRYLRDLGLVSARAGVGTTVRAHSAPQKAVLSMNSVSELLQFTSKTRLQLLEETTVEADARLAELLRCRPGQAWLCFKTLRRLARMPAPIGVVHTWVRPEFAAIAEDVRASPSIVISLLEKRFGVELSELHQDISPALLSADLARLLGVRARSPALRILRHYYDREGQILQASLGYYPEGRFSYRTRMRVNHQGGGTL